MFGLSKTYDDEYLVLYEYLTQKWQMKPLYAKTFLTTYKKSVGKLFADSKKRMERLSSSSDAETRLAAVAYGGEEYDIALVRQAYKAYKSDLRHGKHVGTPIEKATWAILANRSDLIGTFDEAFGEWIDDNQDERFPELFEEVFQMEDC